MIVFPMPAVVCERDRSCRHECDNGRRQKHFPEQFQRDPPSRSWPWTVMPTSAPTKKHRTKTSLQFATTKGRIRFSPEERQNAGRMARATLPALALA